MTADAGQVISQRLDWRQREIAFDSAFPQLIDLTIVVVDGATPELADDAAQRLIAALKERRDLFRTVRWPTGGPFCERESLLFLPLEDARAATSGLVKAAPLLVRLRADQSLRGVLVVLSEMLMGVKNGEVSLQDIEPAMTAFSDTFEDAVAGRPAFVSWRTFFICRKASTRETPHIPLLHTVAACPTANPGAAPCSSLRLTP